MSEVNSGASVQFSLQPRELWVEATQRGFPLFILRRVDLASVKILEKLSYIFHLLKQLGNLSLHLI
jgi:hypothetical protein